MATIPVFRTWVAGEIVTAAYFNSNIRDAGNFFLSWPVFEGWQTVAQSFATGSGIACLLDAHGIDTDGGHSLVTNTSRYTAKTQGRFQHSGGMGWVNGTSGTRIVYWSINGVAVDGSPSIITAAGGRFLAAPMTSFFNGSTDYLEMYGLQTGNATLNTDPTGGALGGRPRVSVRMVGTQ